MLSCLGLVNESARQERRSSAWLLLTYVWAYLLCPTSQGMTTQRMSSHGNSSFTFQQVLERAGDNAVCEQTHQLFASGPGSGDISACKMFCANDQQCEFFTFFTDGRCHTFSACSSTWNQQNPWVRTTIQKKRWPDLTQTSDSCRPVDQDCRVKVECSTGYSAVQCESLATGGHGDIGGGAFLDDIDGTCNAIGVQGAAAVQARVTCRRNQTTFSVASNDVSDSKQLVFVSCPEGSTAISCNCAIANLNIAGPGSGACDGKFTFAPVGRTCAQYSGSGVGGVKITAICSPLATCETHLCPDGFALKSNASSFLCAGAACSAADDGACCAAASCSLQEQLSNFSSRAAMAAAGWELQGDGVSASYDHPELQMGYGDPQALCHGFNPTGDSVLSLKLTGRGVLSLTLGSCYFHPDQAGTTPPPTPAAAYESKYEKFKNMFGPTLWNRCGHSGYEGNCGENGTEAVCVAKAENLCNSSAHCAGFAIRVLPSHTTYITYTDRDCVAHHMADDIHWDIYLKKGQRSGTVEVRLNGDLKRSIMAQERNRSVTISYFGGEILEIRGVGNNTGIAIQRLQLICPAPATLSCSNMGGTDCSAELRSWAGANTCVANVPTNGATCQAYCAQRHLTCVKGMDNDGTKCGLYRDGHGRQTQERNGCLQSWTDQVCVCEHQSVVVQLDLEGKPAIQSSLGEASSPFVRDGSCWQPGLWWQVDLGAHYHIDRLRIEWDAEGHAQFGDFLVKVDGDVCLAVATPLPGLDLPCRSIGRTLRVESRTSMQLCKVEVWVVQQDALWLDLSGMVAHQSSTQGSRAAQLATVPHQQDEALASCTHTDAETNPWWEIDLKRTYRILAVKVFTDGDCCAERVVDFLFLTVDGSTCTGPLSVFQREPNVVPCEADGSELRVILIESPKEQSLRLCEVSVAVHATSVPLVTEPQKSSLTDLISFCFVTDSNHGLLLALPLRANVDEKSLFSDTSSNSSLSFCIDACRKRAACLRIVLDSRGCFLYSHGLGPDGFDVSANSADRSVCWTKHWACHESGSLLCNPEMVATVITGSITLKMPLLYSVAVMGYDLSVWETSIAVAYQDIELDWVRVVDIGVLTRRLLRGLGAQLHQTVFIEYEIIVPPGSKVPTTAPSKDFFSSAFESQLDLASLDLQVMSVRDQVILYRHPGLQPQAEESHDEGAGSTVFVAVIISLLCLFCSVSCTLCYCGRRSKRVCFKGGPAAAKVGRPSIQDEAETEELTPADTEALPEYWTSIHSLLLKSFGKMVYVNSDTYHVFSELLNKTHCEIVTQDRPCPKKTCKKTPGGCSCVRSGGDPGLPIEYIVRRVIRVEDSSIWNRYVQRRGELQRKRMGTGELKHVDPPVFTDEIVSRHPDILEPLVSECNEVYLWHGTHVRKALSIAQTHFDMSLAGSGAGTMYGCGAYMAESSTKADEYAQHEQGGYYDNIFAMVLCRTCLGKYYYTTERQPDAVNKVKSGEFDSVFGDRAASVKTFREMVVYDPDQVYPEYIVLYSRLHRQDDALKMNSMAAVPFHMELPVYWADCHKDPHQEPFRIQYRVRRDTRNLIQQLVSAACLNANLDNKVLRAARRIEDSEMWMNYSDFKRSVKLRLQNGARLAAPHELDGNSETGHVITATLLHELGTGDIALENLDESVNELLLWHGTDARAAQTISQCGFRIPVGERAKHGKRFGDGAYLAEDLKKSLSYAPVDSKGLQYVLLCRAVCGDIHYTEDGFKIDTHQDARAKQKDCVLANPYKAGPREFILLNEKQVYPEFILELEGAGA